MLKDNPNIQEDMEYFGLDERFEKGVGSHIYYRLNTTEEEQEFFTMVSKGDVVKYYLSHPTSLFRKMEVTASLAFDNIGRDELGSFDQTQNDTPLTHNTFFTGYSVLKKLLLPHTLWFIIPFYLVYFALLVLTYRKSTAREKYMVITLSAIALMGIVQFPLPILANGEADIGKQLFMFNVTFDISLFALIAVAVRLVKKINPAEKRFKNK